MRTWTFEGILALLVILFSVIGFWAFLIIAILLPNGLR